MHDSPLHLVANIILSLSIILICAKLGGEFFERILKMPPVLGELIAGILIGPFALGGIIIGGFIYYTGLIVSTGEIQINNFFSFLTAMMLAYQPIRSLATINMVIYEGAAAAERVFGVIDTQINVKEVDGSNKLKIDKANIEFKDVSFTYPNTNKHAIKDVNISIKGGEIVALVGQSGAGKSTILNLLPRFYDPEKGQVKIDGQNRKKTMEKMI